MFDMKIKFKLFLFIVFSLIIKLRSLDIILRVFLSYRQMAHRLAHLNKKQNAYQQ